MYVIYLSAVIFSFTIALYHGEILDNSLSNELRMRRQVPDECHPPLPSPPPPPHHHHHNHHHHHHNIEEEQGNKSQNCCDLPNIWPASSEAVDKCHDITFGKGHGNSHDHHGKKHAKNHNHGEHYESSFLNTKYAKRATEETTTNSNSEESGENSTSISSFQDKKECFLNCVFNISGFLTTDEMLNEEVLNQKLKEETANNTKWTNVIDPVFKKCVAAAKEANSQSQKSCKSGAAEYLKCMTRELFFNCPAEIWVNNSECNELKNKLQKCPNLAPFPKPRSERHYHAQHSRHHEENHP